MRPIPITTSATVRPHPTSAKSKRPAISSPPPHHQKSVRSLDSIPRQEDQAEGIVNVRRTAMNGVTLSPLSEATSAGDHSILDAKAFRRMIALERKRSERSRKPFMLLLLDMGERPSAKNGKVLRNILSVLSTSSRTTYGT